MPIAGLLDVRLEANPILMLLYIEALLEVCWLSCSTCRVHATGHCCVAVSAEGERRDGAAVVAQGVLRLCCHPGGIVCRWTKDKISVGQSC